MGHRRAWLLALLGAAIAWGSWQVFPRIGSSFSDYRDDWATRMGVERGMTLDDVIHRLGQPDTVLVPERQPPPGDFPGLDSPIRGQVLVYRSYGLLGRAYIYLNEKNEVRSWGGGPG
ncbi:MAG: hypothetical protein RL885_05850 [Planctomycetota bacterium]